MATAEFRFPNPVKVDERPPTPVRGGRASLEPAYRAWLHSLQPGAEWEFMPPANEDGTQPTDNPVSRLNSIRKIAKAMNADEEETQDYRIEAVPTVKDKRYRIFGKVTPRKGAAAKNGS
jgi:hypothetical protein